MKYIIFRRSISKIMKSTNITHNIYPKLKRFARHSCLALCLQILISPALFAQEREELHVSGLRESVEILRDQWGVNHIYANNQHDLFFAQGYAAATDRLFQFEIWRRQATGTVSEVFGASEIKRDMGARLFRYRGDMEKELNHYHPQGSEIINAFVDGVNARVAEVLKDPELLPLEFQLLGIQPGFWTPAEVISRHQGLKSNVSEELAIGRAVAKAGADVVKELVWFHPHEPDLTLDTLITEELLSANILELYHAFSRSLNLRNLDPAKPSLETTYTPPLKEHGLDGSNNWVISGDRTTSGFPFMASDPHRAITLPSLRYMVHLNAPGWNVIGGGEPVIPGVSIGHNDHGAWGLTIFETDAEDLYVYELNPENLGQYKYKGKWVDMEEIEEFIPVKGEDPRRVTLRYTLHGPVTYIDSARQRAFAVRCGWLETGGAPYLASLRINQAKNWRQFRKANTYNHLPGENMIWADRKGNIGWQVVGIAPIRKKSSGMVPVPGDGRFDWSGYLPIQKRPHVKNPSKGFFATANEHVTPSSYKHWNTIAYSWADPFRGRRIDEVLSEKKQRSLEDEAALQADFFSIPARTLVPMLNNVDLKSELAKRAQVELNDWDFYLSQESVGAGIYAMWERIIYRESNRRFIPDDIRPHISLQLSRIIQWLEEPTDQFGPNDQQGREEFLVETFEMAVEALEEKLGGSIAEWQYGQEKYKHSRMQHPLNHLLSEDLQEKYSLGPLPRGGNSHSPNATGGSDNQGSGASFRIITDLSDWDKAIMINSPGQSADPNSKYYGNLFELWAKDKFFPAYFTKEKIESHTDVMTILNPRD